jgi:ribosomal protein S12 methylthiotransferase
MRRGITNEKTTELIHSIRDIVPNIALRTTMIVGHPGETEKEFQELYDFVEKNRFDRLGVFTYSHEDQTHSFSMEDNVSQEIKEERQSIIMELQEGISFELNQKKIDKTFKVLFDRKEGGYYIGRTEFDSPEVDNEVMVQANNDTYVRLGDFAQVYINDATEFDLMGTIVK